MVNMNYNWKWYHWLVWAAVTVSLFALMVWLHP
jgi:hypothetical protein